MHYKIHFKTFKMLRADSCF